ncbi:F0F1 ATP synthase subunit delta [Orbaceae bacterium ac157xtp]
MADLITIARPYAKAAFEFAVEHNNIEQWRKMLMLTSEVSKDEQMVNLLSSDMKPDSIAKLFITVCKDVLNEHGENFIKIMAENKRLSILPEVYNLFENHRLERESVADVDVISAVELSKDQLNKISTAVEKRLSRKVNLNCRIDNSIIAGFIVRTGDMVIDSSIRGRLNRLNDALQS